MNRIRKSARHAIAVGMIAVGVVALVGSCTPVIDVSSKPQFQRGWVPGNDYALVAPAALTEYDDREGKHYSIRPGDFRPAGTVIGTIGDSKEAIVEVLPAGTRIRVQALTEVLYQRALCTLMTPPNTTFATGVLLEGAHAQIPIHLSELSTMIDDDRISGRIEQRNERLTRAVDRSPAISQNAPTTRP